MGYKIWLAAAVLGSTALVAVAQTGGEARGEFGPGGPGGPALAQLGLFGDGMPGMDGGPGARGHRGPHGKGGMSPERIDARIDRMAERMVKSVDGTPEQTQKIAAIAKQAAADLRGLRKNRADLRGQASALLKAPTIDRAAIESLRSQQLALADTVSKRASTAFADAAEVLTPEQRVKLAERFEKRRGHRGPHGEHRGERGGERGGERAPEAPRG